jgi:hypothetical protein
MCRGFESDGEDEEVSWQRCRLSDRDQRYMLQDHVFDPSKTSGGIP